MTGGGGSSEVGQRRTASPRFSPTWSLQLFSVDGIAEIVGLSRSRVYEQLATAELAIMNDHEAAGSVLAAKGAALEPDPRRRRPRRRPSTKWISRTDFGENRSAGLGRAGDPTFVTLIRSGPGTAHRYARGHRRRKLPRPTLRTTEVAPRQLTRVRPKRSGAATRLEGVRAAPFHAGQRFSGAPVGLGVNVIGGGR
jgi:hypothetical protein